MSYITEDTYNMNFDLRKIPRQQWLLLGSALLFLTFFLWREYEQRRPFNEAAQGLEEFLKKDKQLECDFLRQQQKWQEYELKCRN